MISFVSKRYSSAYSRQIDRGCFLIIVLSLVNLPLVYSFVGISLSAAQVIIAVAYFACIRKLVYYYLSLCAILSEHSSRPPWELITAQIALSEGLIFAFGVFISAAALFHVYQIPISDQQIAITAIIFAVQRIALRGIYHAYCSYGR